MKKLLSASLLVMALSCAAYAGDMPFPAAGPQSTRMSAQESTTNNAQEQSANESALTDAVLNLISRVLALF